VFAVGILALIAGPVLAQDRYATVDLRGGYTAASGTTGDALKGQTSFGVGAMIAIGSHAHLGLTMDWAHHSLKQADGTVIGGANDQQWNVLHTFLKFSVEVVNTDKVTLGLNAGPGIMIFSPNEPLKAPTGFTTDTHLAGNVGATITYWFSNHIGLVLSPQVDIALKKKSGQFATDKSAMLLPITGGFRFKI
jgi:hypothetical protein